jgi:hypothetical protein
MNTKTKIALAWIAMLMLFGMMALTIYAEYQKEVRQGRIMKPLYPINIKK